MVLLFACSTTNAQDKFSKEAILEDLQFLRTSLEEAHYNLYAYTSKEEFEQNYNQIRSTVQKDSFSILEATSLFQRVISKANNGHTEIGFPGKSYGAYANSGCTLFPLEITFEEGKALVRKNWSNLVDIPIGSDVISINGIGIQEICAKIYPQLSAERPYFKNAKLELYSFPRMYWQVFGRQDDFEVTVQIDGAAKSFQLPAINLLEDYEMKRNELIDSGRRFKFLDNVAYLIPGGFSGNEKEFRQFIDSAFVEINSRSMENLIIDLRNNSGGDDSFSDYLVSYIADKPFHWSSSFRLKTSAFLKAQVRKKRDTTARFWKEILVHKDGEQYAYPFEAYLPKPQEKRFHGNVYVLVNRQSHSQSTVTAAQIQDYSFGTIVGEETGEYPTLYASQFQYALPHTQITVNVSKGRIVRVNGSEKEQGVIPDIFIKDYLLDEEDEILQGLLAKIEKQ